MYASLNRQLLQVHTDGVEAIGGLPRQGCIWVGISGPQLEHRGDSRSEANKTCRSSEERTKGYYGAYLTSCPG